MVSSEKQFINANISNRTWLLACNIDTCVHDTDTFCSLKTGRLAEGRCRTLRKLNECDEAEKNETLHEFKCFRLTDL